MTSTRALLAGLLLELSRSIAATTLLIPGLLTLNGCSSVQPRAETPASAATPVLAQTNVFDQFMDSTVSPADGFDLPVETHGRTRTSPDQSGWHLTTPFGQEQARGLNPGEDWSLAAQDNTEQMREIHAVGNGRVLLAQNEGDFWGNVIVIEHSFYENHERRSIRSLYAQLQRMMVTSGEEVHRHQPIAMSDALLHFELRWDEKLSPTFWPSSEGKDLAWVREHYAAPTDFIEHHRTLFVPQQEVTLVLVDQASYKIRIYRKGQLQGEYDVSFGQGKGQKRAQGDNKTPKGMYFVIQKHQGEFEGPYGGYYGGHWIKINYPNKYDAGRGRSEGLISALQESQISRSWERREPTLESTRLGGGIGFHGWIREWDDRGPRHLSWGCVVMHLSDIRVLYDQIPESAMVVIF